MQHNEPRLKGYCDNCKKISTGQVYAYERKDLLKSELISSFGTQNKYKLTYHVTTQNSFICDRCADRCKTLCMLETSLWIAGIAAALFLIFSSYEWMSQIRFTLIVLVVLAGLPRLLYSVIKLLAGSFGSRAAANAAKLAAEKNGDKQVEFDIHAAKKSSAGGVR